MKRIHFGNIHADFVSMREAIEIIHRLVVAGNGGYIVTPNVDHVVLAERNALLQNAYRAASLSLADGMPLVWASRMLGHPLPARVSGSDLMGPMLAHAAETEMRVYFLGAAPGVGIEAARRATAKHPGLRIVGVDSPAIGFDLDQVQDERARTLMLEARPDLVVVALGCPKQETLMYRWSQKGRTPVMLGLGASLDFLAGRVRRAPNSVSAVGLEWLYRLVHDPVRLASRYLVRDMRFVPILLRMISQPRGQITS